MPVLGSSSSSTSGSGNLTRGCIIPTGSLDTLKAALALHASQLVELSFIGDSTTFGASSGTPPFYSWTQRVRDRIRSAGLTDGGWGLYHPNDQTFATYPYLADTDGYPQTTSVTGWASNGSAVGVASIVSGETWVMQGKGTRVRVTYGMKAVPPVGGLLGVTVDGGTEQIINTLRTLAQTGNAYDAVPLVVATGLTEGIHTVQLRNAGPAPVRSVTLVAGAGTAAAGGSLPASTAFDYAIAAVSANGEDVPTFLLNKTTTGTNKTITIQATSDIGQTAYRVYRRAAGTGVYGLLRQVTNSSAFLAAVSLSDDGTLTPDTAQNPVAVSALGAQAGTSVEAQVEFLRAAGVVVHKDGSNGASTTTYWDGPSGGASGPTAATPVRMGLQTINQAASNNSVYGVPQGSRPNYRNVKLVAIQLGTNDDNNSSATDATSMHALYAYKENLAMLTRMARAAGADVVLISPPYTAAGQTPVANNQLEKYHGRYKSAVAEVAAAFGVVYLDFQEALGWDVVNWSARGYGNGQAANPHLPKAAYVAEGDYFFDKVIAPLLT